MTATRAEIRGAIQRWPGIHFNELVRRLDLAPGQVQHHIKRLQREGHIVREPVFGRTHYYASGIDDAERRAIAMLRRETPRAIVAHLLEDGPTQPRALASELDLAESTVSYHVDRLTEAGLVERVTTPGGPVRLRVVDPEILHTAFSRISPDPAARLTDRFERLVDDLFDG